MRPPLECLIETYRTNLYAAAFSICRNAQDAEDVTQETFIQYWARNKEFESEQHLRAWLLRVAINRARNRNALVFRRRTVPLEDYMETLPFPTEASTDLFAAVMALPEKYRIAIHLFYYEDYTVQQISSVLKISPGNARVRLNRGRTLLRNTLKEAWDHDE